MNILRAVSGISLAFIAPSFFVAHAEDVVPYVSPETAFMAIEDPNREAEAWAVCTAAYEITAQIYAAEQLTAQAQEIHNLSNGAAVGVAMALMWGVMNDLKGTDSETAIKRFNSTWDYSKRAMNSLPDAQATRILADQERLAGTNGGADKFVRKMAATMKVCADNIESQQVYIDSWRELVKQGLLVLPKE